MRPGDTVMALPSQKTSTVERIVTFDGDLDEGFAGQAVTLTLADEIDISRGDIIVKPDDQPQVSQRLNADLVWMTESPLVPGRPYDIKFASSSTSGSFSRIHHLVDVNTMEQSQAEQVQLNEIALVELTLDKAVPFDCYSKIPGTGAFIVIDRLSNVTIGAGMVVGDAQAGTNTSEPVSAEQKARRFNQRPAIVAINAVNPAEIAQQLDRRLFEMGRVAAVCDAQQADTLKAAGLVALVAGGADGADFSLAADQESIDSLIADLQEQGII